uniref:Flavin-containing monooxygenase n=1 Tax=Zonotrichia albicollis TaxID=44394 RepID=A0A8D2MQE5_ZONAL
GTLSALLCFSAAPPERPLLSCACHLQAWQEAAVFDAVLVCSGHHTNAHLPLGSFPGIEKFKGRYLHSRDYKDAQAFRDKRVVVIGIGNSGSDLAVEISQTAQQVFLSTRRGAWIFNRVGDQGYPIDTILTTRLKTFLQGLLSSSITCDFMEKKLNARFDHSRYGLKPKHRYHQTLPCLEGIVCLLLCPAQLGHSLLPVLGLGYYLVVPSHHCPFQGLLETAV